MWNNQVIAIGRLSWLSVNFLHYQKARKEEKEKDVKGKAIYHAVIAISNEREEVWRID